MNRDYKTRGRKLQAGGARGDQEALLCLRASIGARAKGPRSSRWPLEALTWLFSSSRSDTGHPEAGSVYRGREGGDSQEQWRGRLAVPPLTSPG